MSLTQRKSEQPSPANESLEDIERDLVNPDGRHWSKAALSEYYHKSCSEQAALPDATRGDRRGKSFRIADKSGA